MARWQFCNRTQLPFFIAELIISEALGPCPFPREHLESLSWYPFFAANWRSKLVGSAPDVRTKMIGINGEDSKNTDSISNGKVCMYFLPKI